MFREKVDHRGEDAEKLENSGGKGTLGKLAETDVNQQGFLINKKEWKDQGTEVFEERGCG